MVQVPLLTEVNAPPAVMVHTPAVNELKTTGERPDDAEALTVPVPRKVTMGAGSNVII